MNGLHVNAADMSPEVLGVDGESDLLTIPLSVWQRTLDVNLTGFLLAARATIPHLLEAGGGGITNTVSDAIYAGEPVRVGVRDHQDRADGGHPPHRQPVGTRRDPLQLDLTGDHRPQRGDRSRHASPRTAASPGRPRAGRPDDIASMAAYLLSDDGAWVNGQVWSVNGGRFLN